MIRHPHRSAIFSILIIFGIIGCAQTQTAGQIEEISASECPAAQFQIHRWQPEVFLAGLDLPEGTRVIYPDTVVTMDYRPDRMNITIGKTGRIERIYCG